MQLLCHVERLKTDIGRAGEWQQDKHALQNFLSARDTSATKGIHMELACSLLLYWEPGPVSDIKEGVNLGENIWLMN